MKVCCSVLMFFGRLLISLVFIVSGLHKIMNYNETAQFMAAKNMTLIPFALIGSVILELIGGLALAFGFKTRWAALVLFLYLIPVTFIFHNFWDLDGMDRTIQMWNALKNVAIGGGLFYVMGAGPGSLACDRPCLPKFQEPIREESIK